MNYDADALSQIALRPGESMGRKKEKKDYEEDFKAYYKGLAYYGWFVRDETNVQIARKRRTGTKTRGGI